MKLVDKYLGEAKKGFIVQSINTKEYLSNIDTDMDFDHISGEFKRNAKSKSPQAWTKNKKKAMVFPSIGDAEIAIEHSLGNRNLGSIQKA